MAEIPLTRGLSALVDDDDYLTVMSAGLWCVRPGPRRMSYAARQDARKTIHMHTVLTGWKMVDHINGNGLDNRRANMREARALLSGASRRSPIRPPAHGRIKGVRQTRSGKWEARIKFRGAEKYIGRFGSAVEAAQAYDRAALDLFGSYAYLNIAEGAPSI